MLKCTQLFEVLILVASSSQVSSPNTGIGGPSLLMWTMAWGSAMGGGKLWNENLCQLGMLEGSSVPPEDVASPSVMDTGEILLREVRTDRNPDPLLNRSWASGGI